MDMQDYSGGGEGGGSPSSPEMQHCSSTTQPISTLEVKIKITFVLMIKILPDLNII